ncbi:conjugal transfer protein TraC [Candidatus Kaiserbacteria bacterium RIFOXYD1_FULL_42_15]|uniref:Conjugal transfer protein TraC n=1 Tax=Candidatus Kaiserbacteria bacterium RIFOXYD1_FULL_42_15 TaxID=1798532 RepID=A0A1F6FSR4_9BACT|nr:MAG: conjugal transfer protein TraC [Candidatus Kaiserbacteria bacterium RIFOXYD1_FULL_42_15]
MAIFDILNKKNKKDDTAEAISESLLTLTDVIAPSAVSISPRNINLSGTLARVFYAVSYPRFLNDGWLEPVLNLEKELDITIIIHPIDTADTLKKFQKKVAEVQSQINVKAERGEVRDPQLEAAYRNLEDLRDKLQQSEEKLFNVGLYVAVYGADDVTLNKAENEIKGILDSRLIYLKPALFKQEEGMTSIFPTATDELLVHSKFNSSPLSSFFPFTSFDLTSDSGILYGINRHNSSLVLFDRFDLTNYNSVTFATSGAGKSYSIKLEILRSLMFGTEVIVIDPEREYEYLAEATGGRFFNISLSSEHHINPFDLPPPADDEEPADVLRSQIVHLIGLFRLMLSGLTPEEETIVDQAIRETYALKDITEHSDFSKLESPLLSDFEMVLAGMNGSSSLISRLQKYTSGTWSGFMNQPTNVDINQKFVVFSLRDMEDELKTIGMFIVTNYIWAAIRRRLVKRLLVIDEAWWMMKSEDTASFLFSLAKRGRKYYLGIATITQDVDDFLRSPYGVPMITNSSLQFLMKQSPTAIDNIQHTFNLTDEEKYLLLESEVGEGLFFVGLKHVAIKVIASYTEDQIITSDPSQILQIQNARQELRDAAV